MRPNKYKIQSHSVTFEIMRLTEMYICEKEKKNVHIRVAVFFFLFLLLQVSMDVLMDSTGLLSNDAEQY